MKIVYIISVIILFISYLLIKKNEKKVDILKQIALNIVIYFCYNAFVYYVTTFFCIPLNLLGLSGINLFFSFLMIMYIIKTKKIQQFSFKLVDLIYIILLGVAVAIVSYLNFGFPFELKYQSGDSSAHYLTSEMFAEGNSLLQGGNEDAVFGRFLTRKTVSYVNSGLIMKCFQGIIDPFDNYIIFILFGIFTLFLSGWIFYSTISRFTKSNWGKFFAFLVSLLYLMGYPADSMLFGFEYLSMGILVLTAIITSIDIYQNEEIGFKHNLLVFFLLNYGLFASYYMFIPFVYSGLWIYFCIDNYKKTKKIFSKKLFILLFVTLIMPFIFGYIYHITPEVYGIIIDKKLNIFKALKQQENLLGTGLGRNGYIYVNLLSNIVPLLTFSIIAIFKGWKENKCQSLMTIFAIIFIILLIIGYTFGKVSMYYINKNYYALWLLLYYLSFKGGLMVANKGGKALTISYLGVYIVAIIITLVFFDTNISPGIIDKNEKFWQVADIYGANKTILESPKDVNKDEIELIRYFRNNIPEDAKIEVAGDYDQVFWEYSLIRRINKDIEDDGQVCLEKKTIYVGERAGKVDYVLFFNRGNFYIQWKDKLWENAELVYENDVGGILKYNTKED